MIWQKINYIHANPLKARLVRSAKDYYWSSFRSWQTTKTIFPTYLLHICSSASMMDGRQWFSFEFKL